MNPIVFSLRATLVTARRGDQRQDVFYRRARRPGAVLRALGEWLSEETNGRSIVSLNLGADLTTPRDHFGYTRFTLGAVPADILGDLREWLSRRAPEAPRVKAPRAKAAETLIPF